jgi:hypothetical protein
MAAGQLFGPAPLCTLFAPLAEFPFAGRPRALFAALDGDTLRADQLHLGVFGAFGHGKNLAVLCKLAARQLIKVVNVAERCANTRF